MSALRKWHTYNGQRAACLGADTKKLDLMRAAAHVLQVAPNNVEPEHARHFGVAGRKRVNRATDQNFPCCDARVEFGNGIHRFMREAWREHLGSQVFVLRWYTKNVTNNPTSMSYKLACFRQRPGFLL